MKKKFNNSDRQKLLKYKRDYYKKNKKRLNKLSKKYNKEHKKELKEYFHNYYKKNIKHKTIIFKKYYKQNKKKIIEKTISYNRQYRKLRYKKDIEYNLICKIRSRITELLKGKSKSKRTLGLLGCSLEELKNHLESQFKDGMNWDNHGLHGWHIDHIKPCSKFDLSDPKQQLECFNYKNLQPLWAEENWHKSDKFTNV